MIRSTFCHLQGIGSSSERKLWADGILTWEHALASDRVVPRVGPLAARAEASLEALGRRDFGWFSSITSGGSAWRWYGELRERAVYLDIETTGLSSDRDVVTVVGCYDGAEVSLFVRDDNLHLLRDYLRDFEMVITYNGASFDLPFLRATMPGLWLPPVHLDLRYPLRALGYSGGLKVIEQTTGLGRDSELLAVDGFMAVLLWQRHQRGDARALPTLLRYCAEDVVGLRPLAELVYTQQLAGLPDLPVAPIEPAPRVELALPWHPDLVAELGGHVMV